MAILYISHDLLSVRQYVTGLPFCTEGEIAENDVPEQIFTRRATHTRES
jgi:ABC-type microcin C transport system duplicated ATPase subunit YejF